MYHTLVFTHLWVVDTRLLLCLGDCKQCCNERGGAHVLSKYCFHFLRTNTQKWAYWVIWQSHFSCFGNLHTVFPTGCTRLQSPRQCLRGRMRNARGSLVYTHPGVSGGHDVWKKKGYSSSRKFLLLYKSFFSCVLETLPYTADQMFSVMNRDNQRFVI